MGAFGSHINEIPSYNASTAQNVSSSIFDKDGMTIKISNYVIPVKHETLSQTVVVDTYYRQTHIPKSYWDIFQEVFCIVDFTCSQNTAVDYMEGLVSDAYTCNCYGTNYLGMPTIYFDFSSTKTTFGMTATDYTFTPYLNYTNSA